MYEVFQQCWEAMINRQKWVKCCFEEVENSVGEDCGRVRIEEK